VRNDLSLLPVFPKPFPFTFTLQDALDRVEPSEQEEAEASIEKYAIGREYKNLSIGEQSKRYFSLIRCDPKKPSPTITQTSGIIGAAGPTYPYGMRKFTVSELRSICSFPSEFILTGTYRQKVERLGRSVPPLMMRAIAATIRDEIFKKKHT
jgi:DNA (cytosine-5)-methyltransferase 1